MKTAKKLPKLLTLKDVKNELRTRIIVLSPFPSDPKIKLMARKPPIPPVPGPCGKVIECFSPLLQIDRLTNPSAIQIKMKDFNPYVEILYNENLSVVLYDTKRNEIQRTTVNTEGYRSFRVSKFIPVPIDSEKLEKNKPYLLIISDDNSNMLHIAFQIV
jgi:hypothetical protein